MTDPKPPQLNIKGKKKIHLSSCFSVFSLYIVYVRIFTLVGETIVSAVVLARDHTAEAT